MNDIAFYTSDMTTAAGMLTSLGVSVLCGLIAMAVYRLGTKRPSKYMLISSLILPSIVHAVILLVNGSIGAGIAVAGAFSLVRFRSVPGNSRDICILFFAMAAGLGCGMGYIGYSAAFTLIMGLIIIIAEKLIPSDISDKYKLLKITIPEDMEYGNAFDDVLKKYTSYSVLENVKTARMGTMYVLSYRIVLKSISEEKEMLDNLRCINGNLTVSCGMTPDNTPEL
ncbi:MAG: DUF4956 domain-containing protein [Oscillospiraceae bacterium]|nr:DUF4956 domain-containing protein [Oscillospiraceae bacterium]